MAKKRTALATESIKNLPSIVEFSINFIKEKKICIRVVSFSGSNKKPDIVSPELQARVASMTWRGGGRRRKRRRSHPWRASSSPPSQRVGSSSRSCRCMFDTCAQNGSLSLSSSFSEHEHQCHHEGRCSGESTFPHSSNTKMPIASPGTIHH